ncbi:ABC transporter [Kineosporia rhizophila]|uniref:ABC transporter n=1 Tax=Kineosporia TaxID=49184 RepID=UPI001E580EAD|nr:MULTISPECIES: ABC transporter [Kineosporia]MCE0536164.1 ABC transporter [Kineosporia rhizophila]GLY15262.1 ABC transporter [Kineosporia sp. NBRC 101677]
MTVPSLAEALETLRSRVGDLRLDLSGPGAGQARQTRSELAGQVDDYLLPRLRQLDAPLLAVVGGSTGAGKSTLVNTLIGANVTKAGWLRPTTRGPVLVCSPDDRRWFTEDRILPELARTSGDGSQGGGRSLHVVADPGVPAGLALLDAPDIDSVVAENRQLAAQLLSAADLWIFCTTAARYADAVPWEMLHTAQQRSTALAVVINRVPPEGLREISSHLAAMLDQNGLARATLFAIPETGLHNADDRLPEQIVAPLRAWLDGLAGDADARSEVIRTTLDGALQSVRARVSLLAREVDEQLAAAAVLRDTAEDFYAEAVREFDDGIRSGSVLRGEVLSRWQEFVGTGQLTRNLEQQVGRLRDRLTAFVTGRQAPTAAVEEALESSVQTLLRSAAERAAERTVDAWGDSPAGRALLADRAPTLGHTSPEFSAALQQEIRAWQGRVLELVSAEGGQKRSMARLASFGTNGAGLVLMLAVFAQTGGLSGIEFLVAGGTSAASQKVLEAVFGDSAVRALATRARADLLERVEFLLGNEKQRFLDVVEGASPDVESSTGLRRALEDFEKVRRSARSTTRPGAVGIPGSN